MLGLVLVVAVVAVVVVAVAVAVVAVMVIMRCTVRGCVVLSVTPHPAPSLSNPNPIVHVTCKYGPSSG